jgi:hypothetical protein
MARDWSADVYYELEVELETNRGDIVRCLEYKQDLVLRENIHRVVETISKSMTAQVKTWCCIGKGTSSIKCRFEANAYAPGETANIMTEIDNS